MGDEPSAPSDNIIDKLLTTETLKRKNITRNCKKRVLNLHRKVANNVIPDCSHVHHTQQLQLQGLSCHYLACGCTSLECGHVSSVNTVYEK